ncbi:MAG: hypothetical protein J7604_20085 [Sporocytophaga sp.]|uniref:hypothetical protein n=1 Tax=Sporocytophaga sp. TaxID=2231183 RepID=UPI001B057DFC|nr:hypothetical protein [Sporocytophaga sp.]MBO9702521.1 hypothetical protein [Sporocytophaga sp.]
MNTKHSKLYYTVFAIVVLYSFFSVIALSTQMGGSCNAGVLLIFFGPIFIFSALFQLFSFYIINKKQKRMPLLELAQIIMSGAWLSFAIGIAGDSLSGVIVLLGPFLLLCLATTGFVFKFK